jgi:hypothetical protein
MKTLTIDRFEATYAICEDKEQKLFAINISELPKNVHEGDVLDINDNDGTISINSELTEKKRSKNRKLQNKLFK